MKRDTKRQLWIGTQPNPDDRLIIEVSENDYHKAEPRTMDGVVTVTDLQTRKRYRVQRGDCGLGCRCALELAR